MPFLFPLIGLIAGILLGELFQLPAWGILPISAACLVYLLILKQSLNPQIALRLNKAHKAWILLLFCGIGMIDMAFHQPEVYSPESLKKYVLAEGEIRESNSYATGDRFIVDIYRMADTTSLVEECHNFKVLVSTDGVSGSVGDIITFPVKLSPVSDNPNFRPTGFADRMKKKGILYRATLKASDVTVKGFNHTFSNNALLWRDRLVSKIEKSSLNRPVADFITALLLGDRSFLSDEVRTSFSNAGVAHVLALSGLHVTILMGIVLALLFPLKLAGLHNLRYILSILLLWVYVFFTGLSPSTVRAAIMTTFVIVALMLQRRNSAENALLAAIFLILVINPLSIYDIGPQLSVLCVGSILFFAGPLNPIDRRHHPYLHSAAASVLVSLIATAATWVVISYYFQSIPLLFLPVNLCLLPLLPFYIWIAVFYIILLALGIDFTLLSRLLNAGYDCFDWIVNHLSAYGNSNVSFSIQFPVMIIWLFGVLILAYALKKNKEKKTIMIIGGCSFLCFSIACIPIFNHKTPDSVIFQNTYHDISLALYDGDELKVSSLPRNSISRIMHKGSEILSLDASIDIDSLSKVTAHTHNGKRKRYLIIGGGFKGAALQDIPWIKDYDKIILHSSIKRRMENELRQQAIELGIQAIHSLREEGPLEEILSDSLPDTM